MGPVTTYSLMQALGLINDHLAGCQCRDKFEQQREALNRPL